MYLTCLFSIIIIITIIIVVVVFRPGLRGIPGSASLGPMSQKHNIIYNNNNHNTDNLLVIKYNLWADGYTYTPSLPLFRFFRKVR